MFDKNGRDKAVPTLFKNLKQDGHTSVWNTIMDVIQAVDDKGQKNVTVRRFPRYTMRLIADELMEAGYDVTVEIGEYTGDVALHIIWT
jgi:hypothetical protein